MLNTVLRVSWVQRTTKYAGALAPGTLDSALANEKTHKKTMKNSPVWREPMFHPIGT
jgi:hypothetical protein